MTHTRNAPTSPFKGNSRAADKFVVRFPDGMRDRVEERGRDDMVSMNAVIIQATARYLDGTGRVDQLLAGLEAPTKPATVSADPRPILECTGCGTVTRDREEQMALYKRAGALSCCPERNMVPLRVMVTL